METLNAYETATCYRGCKLAEEQVSVAPQKIVV